MSLLSERAMISALHVGSWSGKLIDREVTEEVSEKHKADLKDAGRYSKQLIASRFLKPVTSIDNTARNTHRILTLPWEDNGGRILSTQMYIHYTEKMRDIRIKRERAVSAFAELMDEYISEAKERLGTMFSNEDYPTVADVKRKFWFDVEIKPVPESQDFRAKLSDSSVKAIVKDIERRADMRLEAAMNDVFQRIMNVTGHMVERLKAFTPSKENKNSEGRLYDSTVYSIKELADLLPALNITDDKRLVDLQSVLINDLVEHSPEILRADEKARKDTIKKAEKIYNKVKGYLA